MKTRKSTAIKVGIGFGIIALAALCLTTHVRREIFIAGTKANFSRVKSASEARELAATGKAFAWILNNGKWALIRAEYSCCAGAGYDAVVIHDSDGKTFVSRNLNICGGTATISGLDGAPDKPDSGSPAKDWTSIYPNADWSEY